MTKSAFYWDTSALLALVFQESHTKAIRSFVEKESSLPGFTSFYSLIEIESAINRRIVEGSIKTELAEVRLHIKDLEAGLSLIWPGKELLSGSRKAIMEYNLRPGDSLQLASALALNENGEQPIVVCLDERLNKAAKAAQLRCAF